MSISTGTLNLKFMQRGTPLKASPSGPSTPTPSTPGTPVPASTSSTSANKSLLPEIDSQWELPVSKIKALRSGGAAAGTPTNPSKLRGRISYESSYLPFLERGQPVQTTSRTRVDSEDTEEGSDEDEDEDEDDRGVGSSKMVKGRMIFGQPVRPEKKVYSDDEETTPRSQSKHNPSHRDTTRSNLASRSKPPPSTPTRNASQARSSMTSNTHPTAMATASSSSTSKSSSLAKPDKSGFIRPGGFDDLSTPTEDQATGKNRKKKRKSGQMVGTSSPAQNAPKTSVDDKDDAKKPGNVPHDVVGEEDDEAVQGARKRRKKSKNKKDNKAAGKKEDDAGDAEDPEFEEFLNDLMDEIEEDR